MVLVGLLLGVLSFLTLVEEQGGLALPDPSGADPVWMVLVIVVPVLVRRRIARHTVVGVRTVLGPSPRTSRSPSPTRPSTSQVFLVPVVAIVVSRVAGDRRPRPEG